jgi:hypothetical protein
MFPEISNHLSTSYTGHMHFDTEVCIILSDHVTLLSMCVTSYIFSILLFVTKNKDQFLFNSQVHKINTRQTSSLYLPSGNLTMYQKGVYYSAIDIYSHLPTAIKDLSGDKNKFKLALKRYILHNSFYSLEEYFNT